MDCSPSVSSVQGISQAWILEWVGISFSTESSQPKDQTHFSCIVRQILYYWATTEAHKLLHSHVKKKVSIIIFYHMVWFYFVYIYIDISTHTDISTLVVFPVAQWQRIHLSMQEMWVHSLGWEDPLKKERANHSVRNPMDRGTWRATVHRITKELNKI